VRAGDNRSVEQPPAGTLTMLFSDIEGSTAMVSRLGDQYGEALSAHRRLLRAAFAAWHGREMSTEGDSFFVVFESAADAVNCCLAAQRALAGHDWAVGAVVRVRMGLHSGEPTRHEDNFIGIDVHRAARIAATAHGGQVVLSEATYQLARPGLPAGVTVKDLGFHRLKDIAAAERLYQLAAPGLPGDFPPLKSLGAQTSLPAPVTPLIGRDDDLRHVCDLVSRPEVRLVTLIGPGGMGKTRLSIAAAAALDRSFPHGVFFVPLAAVRDPDVMWKVIADRLDVSVEGQAADAVTGYLAKRGALLALDNLEQLDGAGEVVAELLAAAPGLVVLATSRRLLHVQGEHELRVPPLGLPRDADPAEVAACAAAQLFARQAGMVRPGFTITADNAADVAAICRRLDGLPLAIELAASRVKLLPPRALLARLGQRLDLAAVQAGRPSRQQTLRSTVAWSYDLLTEDMARVFRRMGVFAGGCDLDALAAVAMTDSGEPGSPALDPLAPDPLALDPLAPDPLARVPLAADPLARVSLAADPLDVVAELLDDSLVTVTEGSDGEPRVGMLETIRDYALDRLAHEDDLDDVRRGHAEHYAAFAERSSELTEGPAQLTVMDRLEADHDNLRAALAWSLAAPGTDKLGAAKLGAAKLGAGKLGAGKLGAGKLGAGKHGKEDRVLIGLRLVQALTVFWYRHGHAAEGRRWLQRAMDLAPADGGAPLAQVAHGLGILLDQLGEAAEALLVLERSLAIYRELGDREHEARELNSLGIVHRHLGDIDKALTLLGQAIAINRELGSTRLGASLANLAQLESAIGRYDRATAALREALALDEARGDPWGVAVDRHTLMLVSLRDGRPAEARDQLRETLDYVADSGNTSLLINTVETAAAIAARLDDAPLAARLAGAADALRQETGMLLSQQETDMLDEFLAPARASLGDQEWHGRLAAGAGLSPEACIELMRAFSAS